MNNLFYFLKKTIKKNNYTLKEKSKYEIKKYETILNLIKNN